MPVQDIAPPVVRLGDEGERIEIGAIQVTFKSPLPGSREGWFAVDYTLPARQNGAALHYHQRITESFYVISGELWMRIGDREIVAGPGSYALVPPGTLHAFGNRSDAPVRFLAHASEAAHRDFLLELFEMIRSEPSWPPQDPSKMAELGRRYDTYYL
jgi:mannose-6-phosphate isomerase-like protein (cupin superfamily)